MSREVRYDGEGAFEVRFPYDAGLVERIKELPNRRWNKAGRFWWVPEEGAVGLVDLLAAERFRFDEATREIYRRLGGRAEIDPTPVAARTTGMRGLFDAPEAAAGPAPASAAAVAMTDDLTVSGLNERVRDVLLAAFPTSLWLVGEISGFNRSAHRKHVSFKLVEPAAGGKAVSSIDATLFEGPRREIERALALAGDPFRLEDEIAVRVRVRVELYVPWGSYRVIVEELDLNYTLGEAARRREEIVRRLTEQGLVGVNATLPLPALPLRVGLITSLGSDAYNDVIRTLQESGFAFDVAVHGARVQGHATEPSVLNALDWFSLRRTDFDVLLICRGGGSRTDLAWFDTEALGRAVALFPLPVVVGIGHEQDHSVLDAVGRRAKTPTAAAALLVDTVRENLERLERHGAAALELAARRLVDERMAGGQRARRLALATRSRLRHATQALAQQRGRLDRGARQRLAAATERLMRGVRAVPRAALVHFARQRALVDQARRAIAQGARRDVAVALRRIAELSGGLAPRGRRMLQQERERVEARSRRLHLVDPRRVVERGYAILRTANGRVVTAPGAAPRGAELAAELRGGRLRLRSEGNVEEGGETRA